MIMESHLHSSDLITDKLKVLDPVVIEVIDKLKEMYAKCSNDHHLSKNRKFRNKRHEVDPNFKATIMKKYEGFDKTLAAIRINLQKLTEMNFDKLKIELKEYITQIITNGVKEEIYRMCDTIINEFSKSQPFSNLMAKLYSELLNEYNNEELSDMLNIFIKSYDDIITNIKSSDGIDHQASQEAYDEFCSNNDKNRLRQSMGLFMINIMKYNIIEKDYVLNIINYFQDMLFKAIYEKDKKSVVDELTENIYILIVNSKDDLKDLKERDNIMEKVNTLSKLSVKDCISLTSRSKFKHMDILDSFKQK